MAVFNEQFSAGIPFMDKETKKFISELNKLTDAMKNGEGREYVIFALDYLKNYCESHLELEGKVMLQYEFYDSTNHSDLHDKFRRELKMLNARFNQNGADHSMPLTVQRMMSGWLINHVSKADMVLGDFLKSKLKKVK